MTKNQFEEGVEYVRACLQDIHEKAGDQPLDDDAQARFDAGLEFIANAEKVAARAKVLEQARTAPIDYVETGDGATAGDTQTRAQRISEDIYDLAGLRSETPRDRGAKLEDRAMRSIESWHTDHGVDEQWQEAAEKLVRGAKRSEASRIIAEHVLRFGNPDYVDAFYSYLGGGDRALSSEQHNAVRAAMNEGTTTQGGFIVPPFLDPAIILTNNGTINPFREISTVKTIATQTWKGVTSAGVTAEWTAEAAEVADASPTVAQPSITPVRADAYVQASMELLQDTDIATEIAMLFADAKDRLESTAFAVGTGSTQPKGIVTALQAVTASRVAGSSGAAGAADFVLADVYALPAALPPRHRPNSSWVGELTILQKIRRFGEGVTANAAFWVDLGVGIPPTLLGRPVYQSAEMDNTIVSGSNDDILVLGDFRKYYIVDRIGMEVQFNPMVLGSNRRPTGEVAWVCFWRVGADTVDANAFRMLRV